jgi:hypothetical protein
LAADGDATSSSAAGFGYEKSLEETRFPLEFPMSETTVFSCVSAALHQNHLTIPGAIELELHMRKNCIPHQ